jgi:hypothetical protein
MSRLILLFHKMRGMLSYRTVPESVRLEQMEHTEQPRGLSATAAAAYAGCQTVAAFRAWVRRGIMPKPMPGTRRYDRRAIDLALDHLSQITSHSSESSVYGQWKRQNEGAAQRG